MLVFLGIFYWFFNALERGFDFLGYHFHPRRLTVANKTLMRFVERTTRLYEQERGKPEGFPRLGAYVQRWQIWASSGMGKSGAIREGTAMNLARAVAVSG